MKRLLGLILFLLFYSLFVLSLDAQELSYLDQHSTSQEILNIADEITNIADRWDIHQNYLTQLMEELQESRTDSEELKLILDRTQEIYADLRNDYGILQVSLKRWKTISLVLGVTSVISVGSTIILSIMN